MRQRDDELAWVKWVFLAIGGVAVVLGLIEWNARRQAAAVTREFMRPMTAEEKASLDAQLADAFREPTQAEIEAARRQVWAEPRNVRIQQPARVERAPLADDERCINRQRFKREPNGWTQVGSC